MTFINCLCQWCQSSIAKDGESAVRKVCRTSLWAHPRVFSSHSPPHQRSSSLHNHYPRSLLRSTFGASFVLVTSEVRSLKVSLFLHFLLSRPLNIHSNLCISVILMFLQVYICVDFFKSTYVYNIVSLQKKQNNKTNILPYSHTVTPIEEEKVMMTMTTDECRSPSRSFTFRQMEKPVRTESRGNDGPKKKSMARGDYY